MHDSCGPRPKPTGGGTSIVVIHDTTTRIVGQTHIEYVTRAKLIYDTTYVPYVIRSDSESGAIIPATAVPHFIAVNDTTIGKITISDSFFFPERVFHTCLDRKPDSIQTINSAFIYRDTVVVDRTDPLWKQILTNLGSAAIGVLIGRGTK